MRQIPMFVTSHAIRARDYGDDVIDEAALNAARALLNPFQGTAWICGGWAIDLAIGAQTRPHSDVDIVVPVAEVPSFARHIGGPATVRNAGTGEQRPLDLTQPCEPGPDIITFERLGFAHEVLPALVEGDEWVFPRGTRRIRRRLADVAFSEPGGLAVQQPEIVLLHKSRATDGHDHLDFTNALSVLTSTQRAWLRKVIEPKSPDHPWLDRLS